MTHLLLIDASGFAYRAYHGQSPLYRPSDGVPTWAALGFMGLMWRLLGAAESDKPTHAAAVFDHPSPTFRHKLFPQYKANRDPARAEELAPQIPFMHHVAQTLGLTPVEAEGYEADDVIATLAAMAKRVGMRATVVSSDKDFSQLVKDGIIEIVDALSKARTTEATVRKKFGVPPTQVQDVQALAGDTVDNIPGIKGVGLKNAAALIRSFGSLEGVLENASRCRLPQVRVQLKKKGADDLARLCLKLTTLRTDVPLDVGLQDLVLEPIMRSHVDAILRTLEAPDYIKAQFEAESLHRVVPPVANPLAWWREEIVVSGQKLPDMPQCGFYERRLVRGGPMVPARIWRKPECDLVTGEPTGKEILLCEVGGRLRDPYAEWARLAMALVKESKYHFEKADADHARRYRPDDPKATPNKRPDLMAAKPPHSPKPRKKK